MSYIQMNAKEFIGALASKSPTPGGGGASALVGAVGVALGSMVCNLTLGKKKYAGVEGDILIILEKAEKLRERLLSLIDEDAAAFLPLSRAYGIPKDDPGRERVLEDALNLACSTPMEIMRVLGEAIELHAELARKGSAIALSDVGVGVCCCRAAIMGASLNVFINTKYMTDREAAVKLEFEADALLQKYCALADEVYESVISRLR